MHLIADDLRIAFCIFFISYSLDNYEDYCLQLSGRDYIAVITYSTAYSDI